VTIYYKKTKWRLFTSTIQCRERIVFQPGGLNRPCNRKQNSTRRADFNPVVESAPCNRPLSLQFLRGITMRNMCLQCSQGIQQHVYSGFVWTLFTRQSIIAQIWITQWKDCSPPIQSMLWRLYQY
jgi:hypothetical protein